MRYGPDMTADGLAAAIGEPRLVADYDRLFGSLRVG